MAEPREERVGVNIKSIKYIEVEEIKPIAIGKKENQITKSTKSIKIHIVYIMYTLNKSYQNSYFEAARISEPESTTIRTYPPRPNQGLRFWNF